MSDLLRELSIRVYVWARDPRGQTAAEYVGVLLVVSVIIAAVATTDVGHEITDKISSLVRDISGGDSGSK
jgi:Flp pilus assembly pilin Flp